MAFVQGLTLAIFATIFVFSSVNAQTADTFITPTERNLRKNLTVLVQYVIHPSAQPSLDLINYALVMGRAPKSQKERMDYLRLLKEIGRKSPEFVKKYTTTSTLPGGQKMDSVDENGMDGHITSRALMWAQKGTELLAAANSANGATTTTKPPPVNPTGGASNVAPNVPAASVSMTNTGNQIQPDVTSQNGGLNQVSNNIAPAADGTVSMEDVFRFINSQSVQNQYQIDPMSMLFFQN